MRERPILFSGPMVRAIIDGKKRQTRRIAKPQPQLDSEWSGGAYVQGIDSEGNHRSVAVDSGPEFLGAICPFGQVGDRLWVRETWYADDYRLLRGPYSKPDDFDVGAERETGGLVYAADGLKPFEAEQPVWRPSIHMPRWACRLVLEITHIRLQLLHGISDYDSRWEGVSIDLLAGLRVPANSPMAGEPMVFRNDRDQFRMLWECINGAGSWHANPYVWVISFCPVSA